MLIEEIVKFKGIIDNPLYVIYILIVFILYFYSKNAKKRWLKILEGSLNYHRYHFNIIRNDSSINGKNKETASALIWAINRQFVEDKKEGLGLKGVWRSFLGHKTSIQITSEVFYRTALQRWDLDIKILKLARTLSSTFYRLFLINSIISLIVVLFMDLMFLISLLFGRKSGPEGLYRSIILDRN